MYPRAAVVCICVYWPSLIGESCITDKIVKCVFVGFFNVGRAVMDRTKQKTSPLSEEPEFWRAAPAALDWGVKELDFPPTAPVGEGEATDLAAPGLLRASGMRL